jgi:hypothetical protein
MVLCSSSTRDIFGIDSCESGAILSAPNAPAQSEGHGERIYSDNTADVLEGPPNERPASIFFCC